jgi:hypothetical protein
MPIPPSIDLSFVEPAGLEYAKLAFEEYGIEGILTFMDNTKHLRFVFDNAISLREMGVLERCIVSAYSYTRVNFAGWSVGALQFLFGLADKAKLQAAGDPLPDGDSFTVYRGVAGKGRLRRTRGYSWTDSLDKAKWFAKRYEEHLPDPAVFQTTVAPSDVLWFDDGRQEREFVFWASKVKRLRIEL